MKREGAREPGLEGKPLRKRGRQGLLVSLIMVVAVLAVADHIRTTDYDLYGHILFGRQTLESGSPPRADTYSYSAAGAAWVDHEWLTELAFAWLYDGFGPTGLILWRLIMALAATGLLYDILRRSVRRALPRWALFWAVLASQAAFLQFRPQMVTYLCFTFFLWVLLGPGKEDRRWLLFLPLVMVPWTNAHGGFMAGVGLLGLVAAGRGVTALRRGNWREVALLGVCLAATALATLASPYGLGLHRSVLEQTSNPLTARIIVEWLPLWTQAAQGENIGVLVPFAALVVAVALIVAGRPRRLDAERWAVLAVLGLLAFRALRHVPLAAPALVVAALPAAPASWGEEGGEGPLAGFALLGAALLLVASFLRPASLSPRIYLTPGSFPVQAVRVMRLNGAEGNVLGQFRWGEYVLWQMGGKAKVFMDQRYDSVYPHRVIEEYLAFASGEPSGAETLGRYPHDFALVLPGSGREALLEEARAVRIFGDEAAVLYAFPTTRGMELLRRLESGSLRMPPSLSSRELFP